MPTWVFVVIPVILVVTAIGAPVVAALRRRVYQPRAGDIRLRFKSGTYFVDANPMNFTTRGPREFTVFKPSTSRAWLGGLVPKAERPAAIQTYDSGQWRDATTIR